MVLNQYAKMIVLNFEKGKAFLIQETQKIE